MSSGSVLTLDLRKVRPYGQPGVEERSPGTEDVVQCLWFEMGEEEFVGSDEERTKNKVMSESKTRLGFIGCCMLLLRYT